MSTEVKFRRGTTAQHASFTGAGGEGTVDTDTNRWHTHDGVTAGGFPHALLSDVQKLAPISANLSGTNTLTVSLSPAPAAYAAYMTVVAKAANNNTGAVTLNVNGLGAKAVKKNGGVALAADDIKAGAIYFFIFDGTDFELVGGAGGSGTWKLLQSQLVGASVASVDFTTGIDSTYEVYLFALAQLTPTAAADLNLRASTDGGSSWLAGTTYRFHANNPTESSAAYGGFSSAGNSVMRLTITTGAGAQDHASGHVLLFAPADTTRSKLITWHMAHLNATVLDGCWGSGMISTTSAVDAIQFLFNGTNLDGGRLSMYGLAHS